MTTALSIIPRRVTILTAGTDGGQQEIASALQEPLQNAFGKEPLQLDVQNYLQGPRSLLTESYRTLFEAFPKMIAGLVGDKNSLERGIQEIRARLDPDALLRALGGTAPPDGPAAVICLHPIAAAAVGELRRRARALYPIWAVVGDYHVTPLWIDNAIDRYALATQELANTLQQSGLAASQLVVTGVPVRELVPAAGPQEAKKCLGIEPDATVVLLLAKGQDDEVLDRLLFQLGLIRRPLTILIGTGTDQHAAAVCRERAARYGVRARMFGEATTFGPILDATDVLVAPARGSIVARALSRGITIVSVAPKAQESQNLEFLVSQQAALRLESPLQLAAALDTRLSQETSAQQAARKALGRPEAPKQLAEAVLASTRETDRILAEAKARDEAKAAPVQPVVAKDPNSKGFFEEIGGIVEESVTVSPSNNTLPTDLSGIVLAEKYASAREEEAKAAVARWERRRELALQRREQSMAADAATQADRARADLAKVRSEQDALRKQRAALTARQVTPAPVSPLVASNNEEARWRRMELDAELDSLKQKMQSPDKKEPIR